MSPCVRIGIVLPEDGRTHVKLTLPESPYLLGDHKIRNASIRASVSGDGMELVGDDGGFDRYSGSSIRMTPMISTDHASGVRLHDCRAGRGFHWSTEIDVTLPGEIELSVVGGRLMLVSVLDLETYLTGVITAEMSGESPIEFLKAQCIVARSWMAAASEKKHADLGIDFCNDDCCQRYQGVGGVTAAARRAVDETAGCILIHTGGQFVDANYSKCCGGIMESPEAVWGRAKPGLHVAVDAPVKSRLHRFLPVGSNHIGEYVGGDWLERCDAYCSPRVVPDKDLPRYLGRVDDGGGHFRWSVRYTHDELVDLLVRKYFAILETTNAPLPERLEGLKVIRRGPGGRATSLEVLYDDRRGRRTTRVIDDQYAIRNALHESFLYSSAFDIAFDQNDRGAWRSVELRGAGWGHGAGMCQIGAMGMALSGFDFRAILHHYFADVSIEDRVANHLETV